MHKLRLNVSCVLHEDSIPTDKFLVVVSADSGMEMLMRKIQQCITSKKDQVTRVMNNNGSVLPIDEAVGDMLRDGDEIIAVVGPKEGGLLIKASKEYLDGPKSPKFKVDPLPFDPVPSPEEGGHGQTILKVADLEPYRLFDSDANDWVVAELSPKIREFILARFRATCVCEPKYVPSIKKFVGAKFYQASGSYISVFMKPRNLHGEKDIPIQYNITKADIKEFQRLVEKNVDAIQIHIDHLEATKDSLLGLLAKGMAETDHVNLMIPYKYEKWDAIEGVECKDHLLPELRGRNPIIIVDANGTGQRLPFLKSALKRCVHAHLNQKTSFLFFIIQGDKIKEFASDMCVPSLTALRDVDNFVENMSSAHGSTLTTHTLLTALQKALDVTNCDAITLISGAMGLDDLVANSALLHNLGLAQKVLKRASKIIDVISVDADSVGEMMLINIAENNRGKFTMKRFHGMDAFDTVKPEVDAWASVKERLTKDKWNKLAPNKKNHRLTLKGQITIVDVMMDEEVQREEFWKAEWMCAKKLLEGPIDGSMSVKAHSKFRVEVKAMKGWKVKMQSHMYSVRTGGGYLYQADVQEMVDNIPTPLARRTNPWDKPDGKKKDARSAVRAGLRASSASTTHTTGTSGSTSSRYMPSDVVDAHTIRPVRNASAPPRSAPAPAPGPAPSPGRKIVTPTPKQQQQQQPKPMPKRPTSAPPTSSSALPFSRLPALNRQKATPPSSAPPRGAPPPMRERPVLSSARSKTDSSARSHRPASSPPTSEVNSLHSTGRLMRPGTRAPHASSAGDSDDREWMEEWIRDEDGVARERPRSACDYSSSSMPPRRDGDARRKENNKYRRLTERPRSAPPRRAAEADKSQQSKSASSSRSHDKAASLTLAYGESYTKGKRGGPPGGKTTGAAVVSAERPQRQQQRVVEVKAPGFHDARGMEGKRPVERPQSARIGGRAGKQPVERPRSAPMDRGDAEEHEPEVWRPRSASKVTFTSQHAPASPPVQGRKEELEERLKTEYPLVHAALRGEEQQKEKQETERNDHILDGLMGPPTSASVASPTPVPSSEARQEASRAEEKQSPSRAGAEKREEGQESPSGTGGRWGTFLSTIDSL